MTWADAVFALICATGFGGSFLFINVAVTEIPPITLTAARSIISFVALWSVLRLMGLRLPPWGPIWWWITALGFASLVLPMVLVSWGQLHIESGLAGIIIGFVPIVTFLLAHVFFHDERFTPMGFTGVLIGFMGVVAIIGPAALFDFGNHLLGQIATFAAAVSIGAANIIGRRISMIGPMVIVTASQLAAVACLVPLSLIVDQPWTLEPSGTALGCLVIIGLFGSALPGFLFYRLLVRVGATRASLVAYVAPIVAVVIGALALDERLPWSALLGLVLILIGAYIVNRRAGRAL